jgi:signal transduction histidine kinase
MVQLNHFSISGILIVICYIPLFIFFMCQRHQWVVKIYALHIFMVMLWGLGSFFIGITTNLSILPLVWNLAYISVLFIPVFFLHSIRLLINNKNRKLVLFAYLQALLFSLITIHNQMYSGFYYFHNSFYFHKGTIFFLYSFLIWEFIIIKAHYEIFDYYKKDIPKQVLFLIFGGIGFVGGTMNFLPGFGIDIYPYGNFLIPIHSFAGTYAVLRLQLFDLKIVYKKSVTYSILFALITLGYLLVVVIFEKLIQHYMGYHSSLISILTAFCVGLAFIPLRNKIQNYTDQIFFNTSHIEMIDENLRLRSELTQTEKLKSIATFASGMAHEIKNPLTAIKTFAEYLPQKVNDPEFIEKFVPLVNKQVDRINELVHDLLEYAKPSPPTLKLLNIHKLTDDTLALLTSQAITKKINVFREYGQNYFRETFLDGKQVKQALFNIFVNAFDAMQNNGTLRITTEFRRNKIVMKVTDTGCGISKEDLPHIFDPFFTKKENGTGLGLSITHGIIKEHGGKIFAESKVGQGTTFRIELPIKTEAD